MAIILVVEDEPLFRMSLVDSLRDAGHEVCAAGSGEEALDILSQKSSVKVVTTDNNMPGMSGAVLAGEVRSKYPAIKILMVSGVEPEMIRSLVDGYLSKPLAPQIVCAKVVELLAAQPA